MFAAVHHVTLGGRHYLPGEVIDRPVPEETAKWWLSAGAVEQIADEPEGGTVPPSEPPGSPRGTLTDPPEDPETDPPEDETDTPEDEIDETAEPEEIDVSAGVVPAPAPEKQKRAPRKKEGK